MTLGLTIATISLVVLAGWVGMQPTDNGSRRKWRYTRRGKVIMALAVLCLAANAAQAFHIN